MLEALIPKHPFLQIELFWLWQLPDSSIRQKGKGGKREKRRNCIQVQQLHNMPEVTQSPLVANNTELVQQTI